MQYITFRRLAEKTYAQTWLVDQLIPATGWTLLIGAPKIGKSTFCAQLCASLEEGSPFLTLSTVESRTLYVQADSSEMEWKEQIERVAPQSGAGTLVSVPRNVLSIPEQIVLLQRFIEKVQPDFTIWDSLYKLSNANTNTNAILTPIGIIETLVGDKPFLLIHHPTKDSMGGISGGSGHNSLAAACSVHMTLKKTKLSVDGGRLVKGGDIRLKKDDNGLWFLDDTISRLSQQYSEFDKDI
jgi:RecA-family ATPase